MSKPRILVTSAAGHTGAPAIKELLAQGFPVRAFVRRHDARSEALRQAGAEIFVGDLFDYRDLQKALEGVQRAYHCPPFAANVLHGTMLFALAAEEAKVEVVALMSAWNPHATHPSIFTRELWMSQNIARWMPTVDVVHINPGFFAFPYFFGVPAVVHLGQLVLPFGEGLNAPPANEDIGAVVANVLAKPDKHIGKRYRPTGPKLISPHDVAEIMGRVLGRQVHYHDISTRMFTKFAKASGFDMWSIAQFRHFAEELRGGTYAVGAPTDHVEEVCGRPAENFESTAQRYLKNPEHVWAGFEKGTTLSAIGMLAKAMLTKAPDLDAFEAARARPRLQNPELAHESESWLSTARRKELNLLELMNNGEVHGQHNDFSLDTFGTTETKSVEQLL